MGMTAYFKILNTSEFMLVATKPNEIEDMLFPVDADDPFEGQTYLDKEWHNIHYLLCGELEPNGTALGDAVLGGNPMGPDLGYGHGRLIHSGRVSEISKALEGVDFESLYSSIDKSDKKLEDVYSSFEFEVSEREYHLELFEKLKLMYRKAAEESCSVFAYFA